MTKKTIRTVANLIQNELIQPEDISSIEKVAQTFSIAISPQLQELIDKNDPQDPIGKQFVPNAKELEISANELADPIGDKTHTAVKGIVHRYPDRCLFTPVHVCPVYCRFCFRREIIGTGSATLSPDEMETAYQYLGSHPDIWEVILTGGDPLILKPQVLKNIIERLNAIPHIEIIRIHTRVPVVDSQRINADMIAALKCNKPVYVLLHANHPNELTPAAKAACAALIDAGIPMLSQTILLKELNDNIEVLSTLMREFIKMRIKPYYLHHGDLAKGTKHFRTTIAEGQKLMRQLRGRFSGICQPTYVLDIPQGFGKIPVGPNYLELSADGEFYSVEDYQGGLHRYVAK